MLHLRANVEEIQKGGSMSIFKRKTSKGETNEFHYKFMQNGKTFYGVCEGCTTEEEARAFEARLRKMSKEAAQQRSAVALVENFRMELTGGRKITLADAFNIAISKPRRRRMTEKRMWRKAQQWNDFVEFMKKKYPEIENLSEVLRTHAEAYIAYIRTNGKFISDTTYHAFGQMITRKICKGVAPVTLNSYHLLCKEIFEILREDAGILYNPFNFPLLESSGDSREAFTEAEIKLIRDNLDEFTCPLFTLAIATALREGDICTLRWSDVDFSASLIRRKMNKTGKIVEIPIFPELKNYLLQQRSGNNSEFIFPNHAEIYQRNSTLISRRVKIFLESLGIQTRRLPEGRNRALSVKDLHSCRHTFCYYAGLRGIPIIIVQSIVGHISPEMTKLYMSHTTLEDKRRSMALISDLTGPEEAETSSSSNVSCARVQLRRIIEQLSPSSLDALLEFARGLL